MTAHDPTLHPDHPGPSRQHLPGLDGIRGLAILMVMLSHFIVVGGNLAAPSAFSRLMKSGYLGVDLFFVLSGFLITGILMDSKASPNYFRAFYMRRSLRIFPLYYALLALAWMSVVFITPGDRAGLAGQDSMAWFWLYASNIGMAVKGNWLASPTWVGLGHFWSLAVEEQFYLAWPLLVFVTTRKRLERICIVLVVISPLVSLALIHWLGQLASYVSTPGRVGVLAAGAWLAILWRKPGAWDRLKPGLAPIALGSGVLLLAERTFLPALSFLEPSLALVLGAACVGLAASGAGGSSRRFFLESPVLRWLGKYSYGIYVYHHALKPVWIHFLWDGWIVRVLGTGWPATLCYTAVATAVSLLLAWLSWVCFEGPVLALKSRFDYSSRPLPAAEPSPNSAN